MTPAFVVFFTAINLLAFLAFGIDKRKAVRGHPRISEARLLLLAFLTGFPGAWTGMFVFRHKSRKLPFQAKLALVTLLNPLWPALRLLDFGAV